MPTDITIKFINPCDVYFPGQTISGTLYITCTSQKKCREITITFKGFSKVHWTETKTETFNGKSESRTVHYRSSEEYYNEKYRMWGDGNDSVLPPGTHNFNFSFQLPHNIPSSFESKIGQVRHTCTAKMDIPWGFDKKSVLPYSVNCLYDLNTDPVAKRPIRCNEQKTLKFLFVKSGSLSMVVRVAHSGYAPGEKMLIDAECSNKSTNDVNYTEANIHQVITYYAQGKKKYIKRTVAEIRKGKICPGSDSIWSGETLLVPPLPPSRLQHCNNIDIAYTFKFIMSPSGLHSSLKHKVPLIIGSIPLRDNFRSFPPSESHLLHPSPMKPPLEGPMPSLPHRGPTQPGEPSAPCLGVDTNSSPYNSMNQPATLAQPSAPVFPGLQQYPDMPPPSYNECEFGPSRVEDDGDDEDGGAFAPKYASYNFGQGLSTAPPPYNPSMAPPPNMK